MSDDFADCALYVNPQHLAPEQVLSVKDKLQAGYGQPVQLNEFFRPEIASGLHRLLSSSQLWERVAYRFDGDEAPVEIPSESYETCTQPLSRQWLLRDVRLLLSEDSSHPEDIMLFKRFVSFAVTGGGLRNWTAAVLGVPLESRGSFEIAAYGPGDEIRPHHDRVGNKVATLNAYLDPRYSPADGGSTTLESEAADGTSATIYPSYNSLSIIPIGAGLHHWVSPWRAERRGRFTLNMGQDARSLGKG